MKKVLVLLSSYNGEKFIVEQVKSILYQKGVDVKLLVRDDGSKDKTPSILRDLSSCTDKIDLRLASNVGCSKGFYELASIASREYPTYDYYAFADQDDVWDSDKMLEAVKMMSSAPCDKPCLYGSDYRLVDIDLNPMPRKLKRESMSLGLSLFFNCVLGCTMVFNKAMMDYYLIATPEKMFLHDSWMIRTCFAIGANFYYNPKPTMSYRQHGNNVVGGKRSLFVRLKAFAKGYDYDLLQANKDISSIYSIYLTQEARELLGIVCNYRNDLLSKVKLMTDNRFFTESFLVNFKFIIMVLFNKI